jgi:acyl carrier protein
MATEAAVFSEIQRLGREVLQDDRPLARSDRLIEDLALDSMTMTALAVGLEDRFEVILTDVPPGSIATLGDLALWVSRKTLETNGEDSQGQLLQSPDDAPGDLP